MGSESLKRSIAFFLLFFAACSGTEEIVILHTNDVHGNIRALRATGQDSRALVGGTASLSTFVKRWRAKMGGDTGILLVDAGDIFQGTPEGNETKGRLTIELMNLLRYDAGAIGNHEFDFGVPNLKALTSLAQFPLMAENLRDTFTHARPREIDAPFILDHNGIKIGIGGIITEDLEKVTNLDTTWYVTSEVSSAREIARTLRAEGAEIVVLLSHVGVENDSIIAASVPEIDLIIGGHSHTRLDEPVVVNGVPIVQTGSRGTTAGEIRLMWDPGRRRISKLSYRVVDLFHSEYPPDTEVTLFIEPWLVELDKTMNRVVGRALEPIGRSNAKHASSPLGNLQTDLMREASGADVAFQNKGGTRADLAEGELQLRDLYAVSPFGNTLVTMKLTGQQIRTILEQSLGDGYTPLEISGLTVYYDLSRSKGDRVVNIFVGDKPLDPNMGYLAATNSFLGSGGDAYPYFTWGKDFRDTGRNLLDIERANVEAHPEGIRGRPERRWRSIDEP